MMGQWIMSGGAGLRFLLTAVSVALVACQQGEGEEGAVAANQEQGTPDDVTERTEKTVGGGSSAAETMPRLREDPGDEESPVVSRAVAHLHPTEGNEARGTVTFTQQGEGLTVSSDLRGLPPGAHGYHVHLYGDCTAADGTSAGTHFNFEGSAKEPGSVDRITGNLGELDADESGQARASTELDQASLEGRFSLIGRSVIVHAKGNDPTQPPIGAAGARLACGVIGVAESGG